MNPTVLLFEPMRLSGTYKEGCRRLVMLGGNNWTVASAKARPNPATRSTADLRCLRPADQRRSALRSQRKSAVNLVRNFRQATLLVVRVGSFIAGRKAHKPLVTGRDSLNPNEPLLSLSAHSLAIRLIHLP